MLEMPTSSVLTTSPATNARVIVFYMASGIFVLVFIFALFKSSLGWLSFFKHQKTTSGFAAAPKYITVCQQNSVLFRGCACERRGECCPVWVQCRA
eukprot:6186572-Pleurochrysis_carterae.AAC.2